MTIADRYDDSLTVEDAIAAAVLNRDTLRSHLDKCRDEINSLHRAIRELETEKHDAQVERDAARSKFRVLKSALETTVAQVVPPGESKPVYATLGDILFDNPDRLVSHQLCERDWCRERSCTGHEA